MIRLCSIQPVAERGGSDQALLRLVRSLPPGDFECHVVLPSEPPLRAAFEATGTNVHIVPMRRISKSHGLLDWLAYALSWPVTVARLVRLVRRIDADVVHTNSLHSWYGWAVAPLARRPHVWHAREIVVQSGAALTLERFLTRHFASRVVCGSQAIADQLDPRNVVVIHDSPDPAVFNSRRAGRFRTHAGIPDDVPLAGTVGRLDTWKGFDVVLDAWPRAKAECPTLHLVVAGGPVKGKERYAEQLESRAKALPDVHWLGEIEEEAVADLLADLDVLVLASTEPEPYGLVLTEALATGTPVVATDAGGPREILATAHPGAGRLVAPRDPTALADGLVATIGTGAATSASTRAQRPPLRDPGRETMAEVLREVAAGSG
jgi:glycosyltransferase involved in cell wall biosynthesis